MPPFSLFVLAHCWPPFSSSCARSAFSKNAFYWLIKIGNTTLWGGLRVCARARVFIVEHTWVILPISVQLADKFGVFSKCISIVGVCFAVVYCMFKYRPDVSTQSQRAYTYLKAYLKREFACRNHHLNPISHWKYVQCSEGCRGHLKQTSVAETTRVYGVARVEWSNYTWIAGAPLH